MNVRCFGGVWEIQKPWQNGVELESLARFAVEEHNKKENSFLKFARLVKAYKQLVAGTMYYFTLEANDAGETSKLYEAKVWVKPWIKFKQLQEFKVSDLKFVINKQLVVSLTGSPSPSTWIHNEVLDSWIGFQSPRDSIQSIGGSHRRIFGSCSQIVCRFRSMGGT
ncbi:hypothetical protein L1987_65710 [Smallanthus sonchifolius]|uniref:Uncharacterized protein n=1 Tax=Smallanthus sonchifolius TaxID=185202 RepID=A0ACB9BV44_9ASTR|nr:hypothetical protein L1987_65710 [Smallanthus sonchifolius]